MTCGFGGGLGRLEGFAGDWFGVKRPRDGHVSKIHRVWMSGFSWIAVRRAVGLRRVLGLSGSGVFSSLFEQMCLELVKERRRKSARAATFK